MESNNEEITNINTEKILSIIFIVIGLVNIIGDNILINGIKTNDPTASSKASNLFLFALIVSFLLYIVIVSRNYTFYRQKKNTGEDASLELQRLFGSLLVLAGFAIIFDYFLKSGIDTELPPVL